MAQTGIKEPEKQRQIQRIAQQANDLIERMATIIWAMNTRNDTFESLTNYLHDFGIDFFDNIGINSHYSIEEMDPSVTQQIIVGETRRQIFLTFKEILNNIVKHAAATTVTIIITLTKNGFEIRIIDNGNGFDDADTEGSLEPIKPKPSPRNGNGGNGLRNMKERMAAIGGTFQIFSEKNKGTTVILQIPINQS